MKRPEIELAYFSIIKCIYHETIANFILTGIKTQSIYTNIRKNTRMSTVSTLTQNST